MKMRLETLKVNSNKMNDQMNSKNKSFKIKITKKKNLINIKLINCKNRLKF